MIQPATSNRKACAGGKMGRSLETRDISRRREAVQSVVNRNKNILESLILRSLQHLLSQMTDPRRVTTVRLPLSTMMEKCCAPVRLFFSSNVVG